MRVNLKIRCLVFLIGLFVLNGRAQPGLVTTIPLQAPLVRWHIDRAGDVYFVFSTGKIEKRNKQGALVTLTIPPHPLTSFDPATGQRLLGFDRSEKRVTWFYPDLSVYETFVLDPALAIDPYFVCTSGERDFWVADAADQSLKKIQSNAQVVREFLLPAGVPALAQCTQLREYQSFLFLAHSAGVLIFNSFGKLLRSLDKKTWDGVQFLGEELFFVENNRLEFFSLLTGETRSMPLPEPANAILLSDERMFLLQRESVKILAFNP